MSLNFKELSDDDFDNLPTACRKCKEVNDFLSRSTPISVAKVIYTREKLIGIGICTEVVTLSRRIKRPDTAFLSCLKIFEEHSGLGLRKMLLQKIEREMVDGGIKAIEAIATMKQSSGIPVEFLLENGFYIKKKDPIKPLMRLDLANIVREKDVEKAFQNFPLMPKPALDKLLLEKV